MIEFSEYFPIWNKLTPKRQKTLSGYLISRTVAKGTILHGSGADCTGLLLIKSGQLRAFIRSKEGREITIFRLFDWDICLFSVACTLRSIQFDITITAEKDKELWGISADVYKKSWSSPHL